MLVNPYFQKLSPTLLVLASFGCVGVTHPPSYEAPPGLRIPEINTSHRSRGMEFGLPAGWKEVSKVADLPKEVELPFSAFSETGIAVFHKESKGAMVVWCRKDIAFMVQHGRWMREQIDRMFTGNRFIKGPIDVVAPGWNPSVHFFEGMRVEKGEKRVFSIFMAEKTSPVTKLYGCDYRLIARSSSEEYSGEIERDFIAIVRSLRN